MSVRLKCEAFTTYENTNERKGTQYPTSLASSEILWGTSDLKIF